MTEIEVRDRPPSSPERPFWRQAIQEIRKDSLKTVEEAARQLIALVTVLSGLYFHAITFGQVPKGSVCLKVLFVGPLAVWGLCLLAATLVLFPRRLLLSPYDPDAAEEVVGRALRAKHGWLVVALALLIVSLVWLVVAAWVYLDMYVVK